MCLSAVYEVRDGNESLLLEHVSGLQIADDLVTLTDIMGDEISVKGTLESIDLIANVIKIAVAD